MERGRANIGYDTYIQILISCWPPLLILLLEEQVGFKPFRKHGQKLVQHFQFQLQLVVPSAQFGGQSGQIDTLQGQHVPGQSNIEPLEGQRKQHLIRGRGGVNFQKKFLKI